MKVYDRGKHNRFDRRGTLEERFWRKVDKRGPDECWPWLGAHTKEGYGQIKHLGKLIMATTLSWEIENKKPFPNGLEGCHSCNNPSCVNPKHIIPDTHEANMQFAGKCGRMLGRRSR